MKPFARVRGGTPFDGRRLVEGALMAPLSGAVARLGAGADFPAPEELVRVFVEDPPPVRFVPAPPRARRRGALDPSGLYDARITVDKSVPTRARCWHDLMNALVWGTFPRAKVALHARQHAAISARLAPGARTLPPTRSRELDALALLDEGGLALLARDGAEAGDAARLGPEALRVAVEGGRLEPVVFGHAIYESLALGVRPAVVAAVVVPRIEGRDAREQVDRGLAARLADPSEFADPTRLFRVDLRDVAEPAAGPTVPAPVTT